MARGLDRPKRRKWDHTDSRGASLVEMALILPLLLMLLMGIVSAGLAYNHQLSLTHAAREAGRFGATLPVDGDVSGWLTEVRNRAVAAATGSLDAGIPGRAICVAYVDSSGSTKIDNDGESSGTCFTPEAGLTETQVQVAVERDVDFNALVFQRTLKLRSTSINRFEAGLNL